MRAAIAPKGIAIEKAGEKFDQADARAVVGMLNGLGVDLVELSGGSYESPVMVGDTSGDEKAARDCGIPFAFVEYGFGDAEAPDYRFATFCELVNGLGGGFANLDGNVVAW